MAGETLHSNGVTIAAAVDAEIMPWFSGAAIMQRLVAPFVLGPNPQTMSKKLPKSGSVTASVIAEAVAATAQTVTDTSVTLTLQKAVVLTEPSVEAQRFGKGADPERHARLAAQACAKKFDTDVLALASGFSQSVDAGTSATIAKLLEAAYLVRSSDLPSERVVAVLSHKQAYQIQTGITAATGTFYSNPNFQPGGVQNANEPIPGFRGEMFGIELYASANVAVDTAPTPDDFLGLVFAPDYAIAALYPDGNAPSFESSVSTEAGFAKSTALIKTLMWYQVGEYNDLAGVAFKSDIA